MWSAMVQSSRNQDPGSNVEAKYSRPSPVAMWGMSWHRATSGVRRSKRLPTRLATDIAVGAGEGSLKRAAVTTNTGLAHESKDCLVVDGQTRQAKVGPHAWPPVAESAVVKAEPYGRLRPALTMASSAEDPSSSPMSLADSCRDAIK